MTNLAITDHGNMFGALDFYKSCVNAGLNPIIGCEFYMAPLSRHQKSGSESGNRYYHLVLLVENLQGYKNIIKLSSLAYTEGFYYKPRIDWELLQSYHEGLICLSACIAGEIPQAILNNQLDIAEERARAFNELFGPGNFYLELQDHGLQEQKITNRALIECSLKTGIPLVATNDVHYANREDAIAQDILLCIATDKKRADKNRMRFTGDQFYLKSPQEMAALFPNQPEALLNSVRIAERCRFAFPFSEPKLPAFKIPSNYESDQAYIRELCYSGLAKRYELITEEIKDRADYELSVIGRMGFTGYFLIVADFVTWAKERDIPVGPGRGSGAGSLVAYALSITDIDPIRYNLLFERFLNPERVSMPDFDIDFCFERRGEIYEYAVKKYGKERVGQIITFGTLKARAVLKDVARALDIPISEANYLTKLIPGDLDITLQKALDQVKELRELSEDPKYSELFSIALRLENKNRHTSLHAAGVVIGQSELSDYVPLYRDPKSGGVATQFSKDFIEECGLVKMDFLGLKTLTLLKNAQNLVRQRGGELAHFDIEKIPKNDSKTYTMLGEGKSSGVFQFESPGMQNTLKKARPERIEDLLALNALYRPGPMAYIDQFISSKFNPSSIKYPDPKLKSILEETYGVIVYQEQVMQVAQIIAGYSLGQADILRRAMGKKKADVIAQEREHFITGAVANGFNADHAGKIYDILVPFAGYGFNKSHAAVYAILAYRTAYLKANFPEEFMAATLTNDISNSDKLPGYIDESRSMGIDVVPPNINLSDRYFTVNKGKIFYGLLGIKGLGEGPANEIINQRKDAGPYRDFMDFLERVELRSVGKKVIEILIKIGAFDEFEQDRATLLANLDRAWDYISAIKEDKKLGQNSLFEEAGEKEYQDFEYEKTEPIDLKEFLQLEKDLMGFYVSGHPMDEYRELFERLGCLDLSRLENTSPNRSYLILGNLKSLKPYQTKNGRWMGFGSLESFSHDIDLVFFGKTWEELKGSLQIDEIYAFQGTVDRKKERPSFIVNKLEDIKALENYSWREVHIRLDADIASREEPLEELRDFLMEQRGSSQIFFHIGSGKNETTIKSANVINCRTDSWTLEAIEQYQAVCEVWKE